MKLRDLLLFILSILIVFIGILYIFPQNGFPIGFDKKIFLPTLSEITSPAEKEKNKLVASIFNKGCNHSGFYT